MKLDSGEYDGHSFAMNIYLQNLEIAMYRIPAVQS